MTKFYFWTDVMLRQPRLRASRASPSQKYRGLRVVLHQKLFKAFILYRLGSSVGWYVFALFALETNWKKKHSVEQMCSQKWNYQVCNWYPLNYISINSASQTQFDRLTYFLSAQPGGSSYINFNLETIFPGIAGAAAPVPPVPVTDKIAALLPTVPSTHATSSARASTYVPIRHHSRFFDCLAHPNLSATLATDQKWPLSHLRISYQSLAECH